MNTQKRGISIRRDGFIVWLCFLIALFKLFISSHYSLDERFLFVGLFFAFWYLYVVVCLSLFKSTIGMATCRLKLASSVSEFLSAKQILGYGFFYYIGILSSFARFTKPWRGELLEDDLRAEQKYGVTY